MKKSAFQTSLFLVVVAWLFAALLPAQAARFRKVSPVQTDRFQVAPDAKIVVGTRHTASLGALKVGDRVNLGYARENGVLVVHRLADGVPHQASSAESAGSSKPHPRPASSALLHIHGVVRTIDVQARTLTVSHRLGR